MRAVADDVIVDGGEWSVPAANLTLPAQATTEGDYSTEYTSKTSKTLATTMGGFTTEYEYTSQSSTTTQEVDNKRKYNTVLSK